MPLGQKTNILSSGIADIFVLCSNSNMENEKKILAQLEKAYAVRNKAIYERRKAGETLQGIANDYNITRERVRQIVAKYRRAA